VPKVTIDGRTAEFEEGLTILRAAEQLGIEIPHYCWHPGLSIAGNCRMCLVEVEKVPKLQIACNTRLADGMVVHTRNERVQRAQQAVLEFLLINHPIDCPICDQAGECKLQDYYMDFDRKPSRVAVEEKVHKRKAVELGPRVVLDQERCILCLRCTRFLDEITRTSELGVFERGDRAYIDLAPGKTLDNPYSENVVDICPVGALTSKPFRFRARVWYLRSTESVCTACARGCNIEIYHRDGRVFRLRPRFHPEVNGYWMCDFGRDSWHEAHAPDRLLVPEVRSEDGFSPQTWGTALEETAERLRAILREAGPRAVGIVVSADTTNEEAALAVELGRALGGVRVLGHAKTPTGAPPEDHLLIRADKNANRRGLQALGVEVSEDRIAGLLREVSAGTVKALVMFRADVAGDLGRAVAEPALERVGFLLWIGTRRTETALYADRCLPVGSFVETDGTVTNFEGRVQRLRAAFPPLGEARPGWRVLADLLADLGRPVPWTSPAEIFSEVARRVPAFAGLDYDRLGSRGALLADSAESTVRAAS
jgi:NADH-quinone oxidoreductase subunit G